MGLQKSLIYRSAVNKSILTIGLLCISWGSLADQSEFDSKATAKIIGVTIQSAESLVFFPSRNAPAKVESLNQTNIPAQISAVLNQIKVKVGDQFRTGDILAELDCRDKNFVVSNQQAQFSRLKDSLEFEKRQLIRGIKLAKQKNIGEAELDSLETNVALAKSLLAAQQSSLHSALLNQQHCQVRAPYRGVVIRRIASKGNLLSVGESILETVELSNIEVAASISLTDSDSFEQANSYYFENNGKRYPLVRRVLLPLVLDGARSREARLIFQKERSIAGATGRLYWYSPLQHLPANLLQERNGVRGVFLLKGKIARFIKLDGAQEGRPILLSNYSEWREAQLIMDGRHGLVDGQQVSNKTPQTVDKKKAETTDFHNDKAQNGKTQTGEVQ